MNTPTISKQQRLEIESAVFQKLIAHLQKYPEVQNIDLMNLGYFCRNCFSKWYMGAAKERGIAMDYDQAKEIIYGMPFDQYKTQYQEKASAEQIQKFEDSQKKATE